MRTSVDMWVRSPCSCQATGSSARTTRAPCPCGMWGKGRASTWQSSMHMNAASGALPSAPPSPPSLSLALTMAGSRCFHPPPPPLSLFLSSHEWGRLALINSILHVGLGSLACLALPLPPPFSLPELPRVWQTDTDHQQHPPYWFWHLGLFCPPCDTNLTVQVACKLAQHVQHQLHFLAG